MSRELEEISVFSGEAKMKNAQYHRDRVELLEVLQLDMYRLVSISTVMYMYGST